MSIKAHELPDLIAAAVRKAVADKQITDASLASILHHPITIGLIAEPMRNVSVAPVAVAERMPALTTMGYRLKDLEALRHTESLTGEEKA